MILMEFLVVLGCLLLGTRFGGMGLGLISGIGLFLLTSCSVWCRANRRCR